MSIPHAFKPLGYSAPTELASCGIAHNAMINTGLNGQVRNMRLVLHVSGVPVDGTIDANYIHAFGSSGGCRRYFRFGSAGQYVQFYTGAASDGTHSILAPLQRDMQIDVTFGTTNVTADVNGQSITALIRNFAEPMGKVTMFSFSSLTRPVVFRFYHASIYLNGELSADIVPARKGKKIILWDKVRRVRLEPANSPLLP